ncbi:MAG: 2-C-methyl-D-erythritol 2,4-cyclodiphosphate synthase [Acidimicrobiales bacterium]
MEVWAVVVGAGSGARFGGEKQYEQVAGRRVIEWSLLAARAACRGVVAVVPPGRAGAPEPLADRTIAGGATRSASVRAGLAEVPAEADVVLVHDAARPAASVGLFRRVIAAVVDGAEAAAPAVPIADSLRWRGGGPADRSALVAVQTPQGFAAAALRAAHAGSPEATDDLTLVEAAGGRVVLVEGEPSNTKLTHPSDLTGAAAALGERAAAALEVRVGHGFDVHPFSADPGRALVLGGVVFPGERGLAGHSDADALAHACTDALLGAAGLGDIGQHFPDEDPTFAGADSIELLRETVRRLAAHGWAAVNLDCTVVLEAPKLAPRSAELVGRLSAAAGAPVSVKAKRAEGLGSLGRREGIACWAVALIRRVGVGSE